MFVIDHQGVIRQKFVGQTSPGQLQETVTEFMKSVPGYRPPTTEVAKLSGHATGETVEIHRFVGHPKEVTWFAVSPDGRRLLSSDYNAHELRL